MKSHMFIAFCLVIIGGPLLVGAVEPNSDDDRGPRILLVRPVITRSDAGDEPAVMRRYEEQVESVFKQANLTIVWLPTAFLDSTAARDGTIEPDQIVKLGRERKTLAQGFPRLDVVFVNAIKSQRGPRGLGMSGLICFVALRPEQHDPEMEAFCIVHEMGHSLGLVHAIEDPDPRVNKRIPSIMGEGSYSARIGTNALQQPHIETIRKSKFLLERAR